MSAPSCVEHVVGQLLRPLGRRAEVERELGQLLRRRSPGRWRCRPRRSARRRRARSAAPRVRPSVDHHALGVAAFGRVGGVGQRRGVRLGQLEQRRGLAQRPGDGDHRAFDRRRVEQRLDRRRRSRRRPARSRSAARPPNRAIAPASSASSAGSAFSAPPETANFSAAERLPAAARQARATRPRRGRGTGRSGSTGRAGRATRPMLPRCRLHRPALVRVAYMARRRDDLVGDDLRQALDRASARRRRSHIRSRRRRSRRRSRRSRRARPRRWRASTSR